MKTLLQQEDGMETKRIVTSIVTLAILAVASGDALARERRSSGSYQGPRAQGTFQRNVARSPGKVTKDITWQNEHKEGSRHMERNWDKATGTGTYQSTTTGTSGKTISRQGSVTKTDQNSYIQQGTITGPNGRTTDVNRTMTKNDDGTRSVATTYTRDNGTTINSSKSITYQDGVRNVTGSYSSSTGKSGTFTSESRLQDGKILTERSLTNQDGKTWKQNIELERDGDLITRDVRNTEASGESKSFTQSVTIDNQEDH
jgi:hypothetical protein